jgi:hypothetical protein
LTEATFELKIRWRAEEGLRIAGSNSKPGAIAMSSKEQRSNKEAKKKPALTLKEKKAAKKAKKEAKTRIA